MVTLLVTVSVALLVGMAEVIHSLRCRRLAALAYGPKKRPAWWVLFVPWLRVVSLAALTWGMLTLLELDPKVHKAESIPEYDIKHVLLVLDVSPSMRLQDAGAGGSLSRLQRVAVLMESFFDRIAMEQYRVSVVAVYNGAKPVVVDTKDAEVVRNILTDLPMQYAFESGRTKLFDGLEEAAKIARPWRPRSATLVLLSDGDTVPAQGMPKMPASIGNVLVVGVGDPQKGMFISGRQSRQDISTLRQIAGRLRGHYHNGNEMHLSSAMLNDLVDIKGASALDKLSKREYALMAIALGGLVYAFLPVLLHYFGTKWVPGVLRKNVMIRDSATALPAYRRQSAASSRSSRESSFV